VLLRFSTGIASAVNSKRSVSAKPDQQNDFFANNGDAELRERD